MSKKLCSDCGVEFQCTNETSGCRCENYNVPHESLDLLKKSFDNCLCEACLSKHGTKNTMKEK